MIRGKKPGMTIGIRAEMDAVAMKDEKTVDYASSIEGLMHASGHDGHIAALIGTGLVLSRLKEELVGNVKLIFQPDEEGTGGAESMIREGALEDPHVDIMLGAHIWNELPYGKVETASGPFFAASDRFVITVTGAIGHAARPHVACDAITVAAQIVTSLQQVVSRMVDPMAPAVLTIGTINGGVRANVIADKVVMEGNCQDVRHGPQGRDNQEDGQDRGGGCERIRCRGTYELRETLSCPGELTGRDPTDRTRGRRGPGKRKRHIQRKKAHDR